MAKNKGQGAATADITVNREGDVVAPQAPAPENPAPAEAGSFNLAELLIVPANSRAAEICREAEAQQLAEHEGRLVYEPQWNLCLSLAFQGTGADMLTDWGDVPLVLANFIMDNPTAPSDAARIHVKRTLKVALLPNEDPRRVDLALQLFGTWLEGWQTIDRQDAEARAVAAMPAQVRSKADPDGPFAMEEGGLAAKSDFAQGFE